MGEATFTEIQGRFEAATAASAGVSVSMMSRSGTLVISEASREGSNTAVAYHVGSPTLIRTDPSLYLDLEDLTDASNALEPEEFRKWAVDVDWVFLDGADQHVISSDKLCAPSFADQERLVGLDRANVDDRSLIAGLLDVSDPDDVDAAEFAMDELDTDIVGLVGISGELLAMASGREWESDTRFDDIGVLTHPGRRGHGLGRAVVAAFCVESFDRSRLPLYRCNWSRVASKALALSLGFEVVGQLTAVEGKTSRPESANNS